MQHEIRRGGELGLDADRVRVGTGVERAVRQRPLVNLRRESGAAATLVQVDQEGTAAHHFPTGVAAVREDERRLADVLLIAENLLLQARGLADSGAPQEAVEAFRGTRWSAGWRTNRSVGDPPCCWSRCAATAAPNAAMCGARTP